MKIVELFNRTISDGSRTLANDTAAVGMIEKIETIHDSLEATADITFTSGTTPILTVTNLAQADATWYPRNPMTEPDGTSTTDYGEKIFVTEPIQVTIAQGGASKWFHFRIYISDK